MAKKLNAEGSSAYQNFEEVIEDINSINTTIIRLYGDNRKALNSLLQNTKFFLLLVFYPAIWLKLLLTLTFWITMDEVIISETIQQLFNNINMEQNDALKAKFFSANKFGRDNNVMESSRKWFDLIIYDLYEKRNDKNIITIIKGIVKNMVQYCNDILGNEVGTRAQAACEASARGTALFHYIRMMGCLSGLVEPESPECQQITEALKSFIESVDDVQPMDLD
jgi:hypothetical protein